MNLSKYGINIDFTPNTNISNITITDIQEAKRIDKEIQFAKKRYKLYNRLGQGVYGKTYKAMANGTMYALKIIKKESLLALLTESIIHILLMKESEHEENGPFVPRFYEFAYNSEVDEAYIVSELMVGTLSKAIQENTKEENDFILTEAITQISEALDFFGERLQFNHRDLKPDNIMYTKTPYGAYSFKLIDFGFSCLTWEGLSIQDEEFFTSGNPCFKKDRDIPQLLYYLVMYIGRKYISDNLLTRFDTILISKIQNDKKCYMIEGCTKEGLKGWQSSYIFLNRKNVSVPSGRFNLAKQHMNNYTRGKPFTNISNTKRNTKRLLRNNTRKLNTNLIFENE